MAESRKLKILCLHGYRQNGPMFREKTGSFRKLVKKYADFVFITAPHRVPPGNMGSAAWAKQAAEIAGEDGDDSAGGGEASKRDTDERGWWFSREDDYFKSTDYSDVSKGFDASLDLVVKTLEDEGHGGFDGVLGFSQGASLLSMLSLMQQNEKKNWFKFAILASGFRSPSSNHDIYYVNKAAIPSLHVFGESDQIVVTERSKALSSFFENPRILLHPGGHFMPATAAQKKVYIEFLEEMSQLCCIS